MLKDYGKRLVWLVGGMLLSAVGITMMLQANIGVEPWSVLQQGISLTFGVSYGFASVIVGAAVILIAVGLGESFGFGTVINIVLCAIFIDLLLWLDWIPMMHSTVSGTLMLVAGLELLVLGTWMYMGSRLGSGPRDALMVVLARKTGRSVGLGSLFNLNFKLLHFDAARLHQETVAETIRILRSHT